MLEDSKVIVDRLERLISKYERDDNRAEFYTVSNEKNPSRWILCGLPKENFTNVLMFTFGTPGVIGISARDASGHILLHADIREFDEEFIELLFIKAGYSLKA